MVILLNCHLIDETEKKQIVINPHLFLTIQSNLSTAVKMTKRAYRYMLMNNSAFKTICKHLQSLTITKELHAKKYLIEWGYECKQFSTSEWHFSFIAYRKQLQPTHTHMRTFRCLNVCSYCDAVITWHFAVIVVSFYLNVFNVQVCINRFFECACDDPWNTRNRRSSVKKQKPLQCHSYAM